MYPEIGKIAEAVKSAGRILIIQADNPDADSLGSALALEHILGDQQKEVFVYCAVDFPGYLRYMLGWDRVSKDMPNNFDLSIIVDASTMTLLERLSESAQQGWVSSKPCILLDHHEVVEHPIPFASISINDSNRASTGELIYLISKEIGWKMTTDAQEFIMSSILGDTQGLSNDLASADTYRIMAEMIDNGVKRPQLEELRREYSKMPKEIYSYKADLIKRTEFNASNTVATVTVPQDEISKFSPLYNPGPLIQGDMLQTTGVRVAIVFKTYDDGRVTAAIRCNPGNGVAASLAEMFGGGGHAFASGFKVTDGRTVSDIKSECVDKAEDLLKQIDEN
ncbi:MAG: bifunctional oligoribonuclease/PAP phosphatase NrnA [Candidatus Saccharimonadales bacterium]